MILEKLKTASLRMTRVSDYLYLKKVPQPENNALPEQALDFFQDSIIQQIFKDLPI